jgi:DNA-binding beta-propeller fold protein YncE
LDRRLRGKEQSTVKSITRLLSAALVLASVAGAFALSPFRREKESRSGNPETPAVMLAAFSPAEMCLAPELDGSEPHGETLASAGGELPPIRLVFDPYPTFNGIALDTTNNRIAMSDENRKSVLIYDRAAGTTSSATTAPLRQVIGPDSQIGYIAGVTFDPAHREIYAVNNDLDDRIVVFDDTANGDVKPKRRLYVPHQAWGISVNPLADQFAISVQQLSMVAIYRREASGLEAPLRIIEGPSTGLADPHGIHWDATHHEIVVANHGNYSVIASYSAYDAGVSSLALSAGGHFLPPSLTVFPDSAKADTKPVRTIQGTRTQLNWPMGIDIDNTHEEIAVANNGDNSILVFRRSAQGDAEPVRVIRGPRTGIVSPMSVAIDAKNDEIWVANYGDHTAAVFSRTAAGNAAPKRIVRNAPAGTPTGGFGNPYAVAYDSKRDQLLVPN